MRLKHTSLAIALMVLLPSVGYPQPSQVPRDPDTPDFRVEVRGDVVVEFSTRVRSYVELRSELRKGLPALRVTDDPAAIRRAERALARRIRSARSKARQGDIFTPTIGVEFRKALLVVMDVKTWESIMDDNPGAFSARINGTYPEKKPLSTVPVSILAALPKLPDDVEYRFLGRHLVLLDTRARVLLDGIPYAIQCADPNKSTCR